VPPQTEKAKPKKKVTNQDAVSNPQLALHKSVLTALGLQMK